MPKSTWKRGLHSKAMALHPSQLEAAKEFDKQRGCEVEYDNHCSPVFHSRAQRKRYARAHGFRDLDGSYGDP